MKILNALWFSQMDNIFQIGIVIGKDEITDKIKCYIGNTIGGGEKTDREHIAETGAKFPLDAAKIMFPHIFEQ